MVSSSRLKLITLLQVLVAGVCLGQLDTVFTAVQIGPGAEERAPHISDTQYREAGWITNPVTPLELSKGMIIDPETLVIEHDIARNTARETGRQITAPVPEPTEIDIIKERLSKVEGDVSKRDKKQDTKPAITP